MRLVSVLFMVGNQTGIVHKGYCELIGSELERYRFFLSTFEIKGKLEMG